MRGRKVFVEILRVLVQMSTRMCFSYNGTTETWCRTVVIGKGMRQAFGSFLASTAAVDRDGSPVLSELEGTAIIYSSLGKSQSR